MPFYDKVKRQVRGDEDGGDADEQDSPEDDTMGFDQLKQGAADRDEEDEQAGDDTAIEVLQDGKLQPESQDAADGFPEQEGNGNVERQAADVAQAAQQQAADRQPQSAPDVDTAEVTTLLKQVTEQNEQIISLLRGIKRGLEQ